MKPSNRRGRRNSNDEYARMSMDEQLWRIIFIIHAFLLVVLWEKKIYQNIPFFAFLIAQDFLQTPVLLGIYHHSPQNYLTAYTVGKSIDIIATSLAIGELLWKEHGIIGLTLEYYMMTEAIIHYLLNKGYPHFWNRVEFWMKPVYIALQLIWIYMLAIRGNHHDKEICQKSDGQEASSL